LIGKKCEDTLGTAEMEDVMMDLILVRDTLSFGNDRC
jgi:hypothetical protein